MIRLTVTGAPRTKKNSMQINARGGSPVPFPSKAWRQWLKNADVVGFDVPARFPFPVDYPVNCRAIFFRDRRIGDAVGYYQGLADLLEKRDVVADDKWIVSWDGSRLDCDRERPRVEVELEVMPRK